MRLAIAAMLGTQPRTWILSGQSARIGRDSSNTIQIVDGSVSREHAEIVERGGHLLLRDLHSKNGTRLNGVRVRDFSEVRIGDRIEVGKVALQVTDSPSRYKVEFSDPECETATIVISPAETLSTKLTGGPGAGELVKVLEKAGRLLVQHRSLQTTCDEFLQAVGTALPATRLALLLRADPRSEPVQVAVGPGGPCSERPLMFSKTTLLEALNRRTAVTSSDTSAESTAGIPRRVTGSCDRSAVAVPLLHEGKALGLIYAEHDDPEFRRNRENLEILTLFANMVAVRIANDKLMDMEKKHAQLEHELAMASRIQRWLLPVTESIIHGYEFHARLEPCQEVGGDFYDIHPAPDGTVWFMLGDVSGKGICAAILMSILMSSARVLYDGCADPGALATRLNSLLARRSEAGHFATTFFGRLAPSTGTLHYVNAGHTTPMIVSRRALDPLKSTGIPLGVESEFEYQAASVDLCPDTLLALFTDGIPEARRGRVFFGDRRVARAVREAAQQQPLKAAGQCIIETVDEFLAGRPRGDDIALMLVRREGIVSGATKRGRARRS